MKRIIGLLLSVLMLLPVYTVNVKAESILAIDVSPSTSITFKREIIEMEDYSLGAAVIVKNIDSERKVIGVSATLSGPDAANFEITSPETLPTTIEAGESVTFILTNENVQAKSYSVTLNIAGTGTEPVGGVGEYSASVKIDFTYVDQYKLTYVLEDKNTGEIDQFANYYDKSGDYTPAKWKPNLENKYISDWYEDEEYSSIDTTLFDEPLTQDRTVYGYCYELTPFKIDIGEKHTDLFDSFKQEFIDEITGILGDADYNPDLITIDGSVVTIPYPVDPNTKYSLTDVAYLGYMKMFYALGDELKHNGEHLYAGAIKDVDSYATYEDYQEDMEDNSDVEYTGKTVYVIWSKPIEEVKGNIERPIVGTNTSCEKDSEGNYDIDTVTNPPVATIEDSRFSYVRGVWVQKASDSEESDYEPFVGTFEHDKEYKAGLIFTLPFGYYYDESITKIAVTNAQLEAAESVGNFFVMILKTKPIGYYSVNDNLSWTRGSNSGLEITIKNTEDDTQTYENFTNKVSVDGKVVDDKNYKYKEGSLILTLNKDFLSSLTNGDHKLNVEFEDGQANVNFRINVPYVAPKTGIE